MHVIVLVLGAIEDHAIAWVLAAISIGVALGAGWAAFRSKGTGELTNLMEQRIRIQDGEIERLNRENASLKAQNDLLTNGIGDRIVAVVERVMGDPKRGS